MRQNKFGLSDVNLTARDLVPDSNLASCSAEPLLNKRNKRKNFCPKNIHSKVKIEESQYENDLDEQDVLCAVPAGMPNDASQGFPIDLSVKRTHLRSPAGEKMRNHPDISIRKNNNKHFSCSTGAPSDVTSVPLDDLAEFTMNEILGMYGLHASAKSCKDESYRENFNVVAGGFQNWPEVDLSLKSSGKDAALYATNLSSSSDSPHSGSSIGSFDDSHDMKGESSSGKDDVALVREVHFPEQRQQVSQSAPLFTACMLHSSNVNSFPSMLRMIPTPASSDVFLYKNRDDTRLNFFEYNNYVQKFNNFNECGSLTCQDAGYRYSFYTLVSSRFLHREHFHCLRCTSQVFAKKEEMIRHFKWHRKREESLQHGFMRYSPLDNCADRFVNGCSHNGKQTHYHCLKQGCDKVYISTSDVQMHANYHRKDSAILREGFQRFRSCEDCGQDSCVFRQQKTTHFHCRRSGCLFTFKNKGDMDDQLTSDGFKKFMKQESCGFYNCRFSRVINHIHCIRPGCSYILHSSGQLYSHKRKHEKLNMEINSDQFQIRIQNATAEKKPEQNGFCILSSMNEDSLSSNQDSDGGSILCSKPEEMKRKCLKNQEEKQGYLGSYRQLKTPMNPESDTEQELFLKRYFILYEKSDHCFSRCGFLGKRHHHCKYEACSLPFESSIPMKEHAERHEQQEMITQAHFTYVLPGHQPCPYPKDCPYENREKHYHCLWSSASDDERNIESDNDDFSISQLSPITQCSYSDDDRPELRKTELKCDGRIYSSMVSERQNSGTEPSFQMDNFGSTYSPRAIPLVTTDRNSVQNLSLPTKDPSNTGGKDKSSELIMKSPNKEKQFSANEEETSRAHHVDFSCAEDASLNAVFSSENSCGRPFCKLKRKDHYHCIICNQAFSGLEKMRSHCTKHAVNIDKKVEVPKNFHSSAGLPKTELRDLPNSNQVLACYSSAQFSPYFLPEQISIGYPLYGYQHDVISLLRSSFIPNNPSERTSLVTAIPKAVNTSSCETEIEKAKLVNSELEAKKSKVTPIRLFKDEPIPPDCGYSYCGYREHQTHFHCKRKDCGYSFCDKTRFVQHTARHERLDTLMGGDFRQYRANVPCGRPTCTHASVAQNKSSHFHCLTCDFVCSDTNKVVAHRRQHQKLTSINAAGFERYTPLQDCQIVDCQHNQRQTHYHCIQCKFSVLGMSQMSSHRYKHEKN